ncbi:MAG TPA: hypothetical protein PLU35_13795 [Phycisphaerales bacterium]|nr:hypothetical protein [Phycisphaerales bacterium]
MSADPHQVVCDIIDAAERRVVRSAVWREKCLIGELVAAHEDGREVPAMRNSWDSSRRSLNFNRMRFRGLVVLREARDGVIWARLTDRGLRLARRRYGHLLVDHAAAE